jgi:hypothetical protein
MPKRRIDAFDAGLTEEQRWQLYDRMQRFAWYDVAAWAAEQFKIPAPSRAGLYRFTAAMRERESAHRIETALSVRENVRRQMDAVGDMDGELEFAWEQLAMESAMKGDADAGLRYLAMSMKLRESALERDKLSIKREAEARAQASLALDREKFEDQKRRCEKARAELHAVVAQGGLDAETIAKIEEAAGLL